MSRVYNFSAGPSMLPLDVLETAGKEITEYRDTGMSVMEMSHRSKGFIDIAQAAESGLRHLLNIPSNYKVLFLQGGASTQFAMIPLNLMNHYKAADFIITGSWAKKACSEAKKFGKVNIIASSEESVFSYIPKVEKESFSKDADYVHITMNNTIYGTRFTTLPDIGDKPLVADMSSNILSETIDVSKFGLIYAGAQKNIGPAGLTIVIIREDLMGHAREGTPTMLDYKVHADNDSMYNTPPTYGIYMAKLMFDWLTENGGIEGIQKTNEYKAGLLYDAIDGSNLFKCPVAKEDRSLMNVVFTIGDKDQETEFINEAKKVGLVNLGGHRSIGGMRASIYNAMPVEGVKALIAFMKEFELKHK